MRVSTNLPGPTTLCNNDEPASCLENRRDLRYIIKNDWDPVKCKNARRRVTTLRFFNHC